MFHSVCKLATMKLKTVVLKHVLKNNLLTLNK